MPKRARHFVLIVLWLAAAVILFYVPDVSWLAGGKLNGGFWKGQGFRELSLLLLLGPVIYAAVVFRVRGGLATALVASVAILPYAFLFSPETDPLFRLIAFAIIALLLGGFIGLQLNNQERLEKQHASLENFLSETIGADERQKRYLARELHDESLQALVDISHDIDELEEEQDAERLKESLERLRHEVDGVVEGTRRFILGLRPPLLEEMGIATSLKWLADDMCEEGELEVSATIEGEERPIPDPVELAVFRIAQETLNNARKHARATRVDLTLTFEKDRLRLRVADNGTGFTVPPPDQLATDGKFGLVGMAERARLAGGSFKIDSAPWQGTTVTLEMPA
jgi:two-component system NarL family sensor kinase